MPLRVAKKSATITGKRAIFEKLPRTFKKLVSILATSVPVTDNSGKGVMLIIVPCIYYLVLFQQK